MPPLCIRFILGEDFKEGGLRCVGYERVLVQGPIRDY